ncbi:hypothetical protein [Aquabacterium sp.]|uniref:hypothetical protein n=1 Tax=Aquabacterium sp. TaxID=1872578 RepID=UPI00248969C0|nr:hypothetical protein [Aquabacterium sp.]MDI1347756.1 hypothetical protein [Aquabacterium sp.]
MDTLALTAKVITFQQGAGLACIAGGLFALQAGWRQLHLGQALVPLARAMAWLVLCAVTLHALAYLFYPTFQDHVEATVASLGLQWLQGGEIYPPLDTHHVNGLLYGPALAEVNALGMRIWPSPIEGAKLPGVLGFLAALALSLRLLPHPSARLMLLWAAPFGLFLFFNRAEPFLLLCTVLALWVAHRIRPSWLQWGAMGCLMGLASGFKLHGAAYVAMAWVAVAGVSALHVKALVTVAMAAALTFLLLFAPAGVGLAGFFHYLQLAGKHGLVARMVGENLLYVLALWLPLLGWRFSRANTAQRHDEHSATTWLAVLLLQLLLALVAAKRGAGLHHLIPLVPVNAWLLQAAMRTEDARRTGAWLVHAMAISFALTAGWKSAHESQHMAQTWHARASARAELQQLGTAYPGLVLASGSTTAGDALTHLRPLLQAQGVPQIDYPAWLDLQLSGTSTRPVLEALTRCHIPHLAVARGEMPFRMVSSYTQRALFDEDIQKAVDARYVLVERHAWFDVLRCAQP